MQGRAGGAVPWHRANPQQVSAAVPLITLDALMRNTVESVVKAASIVGLWGEGDESPHRRAGQRAVIVVGAVAAT